MENENPGGVRETPTKPTNLTSRTSVLMTEQRPATTRTSLEVDAFLADLKVHKESSVSGRLIFALDATMSRKETWDMACQLQGDMFQTVAGIGGLSVQLVYYRDRKECRTSKWVTDPNHLASLMTRIECRARVHADRQGSIPRQARDQSAQSRGTHLRR
jgi:hypothetical protein